MLKFCVVLSLPSLAKREKDSVTDWLASRASIAEDFGVYVYAPVVELMLNWPYMPVADLVCVRSDDSLDCPAVLTECTP